MAFYFGVEVCDYMLVLTASEPQCISAGLVFSLFALSVMDDEYVHTGSSGLLLLRFGACVSYNNWGYLALQGF